MANATKLKTRLKRDLNPSGNIISLSKHFLSLDTNEFVDKKLNFVPTPTKYCQNNLIDRS